MDIKIILTIKNIRIELTPEELKELRKVIDDIIPVETLEAIKEFVPYPIYPSCPPLGPNVTWKFGYDYSIE